MAEKSDNSRETRVSILQRPSWRVLAVSAHDQTHVAVPASHVPRRNLLQYRERWEIEQKSIAQRVVLRDSWDCYIPDAEVAPDQGTVSRPLRKQKKGGFVPTAAPALDVDPEAPHGLPSVLVGPALAVTEVAAAGVGELSESAPRRPLRYVAGCDISFINEAQLAAARDHYGGGGTDQASRPDGLSTDVACASLVIQAFPSMQTVYQDYHVVTLDVPYIPGFLAFREVPHLLALFARLKQSQPQFYPDVVVVDGNGILHHRRCGVASHLGVMLDLPTVGIAKNLLVVDGITFARVDEAAAGLVSRAEIRAAQQQRAAGAAAAGAAGAAAGATGGVGAGRKSQQVPVWMQRAVDDINGEDAGDGDVDGAADRKDTGASAAATAEEGGGEHSSRAEAKQSCWAPLVGDSGDVLAAAVITSTSRSARNPVFVSQGHRLSLETAVEIALRCSQSRVCEPIRAADLGSRDFIRKYLARRIAAAGKDAPNSTRDPAPAPASAPEPAPASAANCDHAPG